MSELLEAIERTLAAGTARCRESWHFDCEPGSSCPIDGWMGRDGLVMLTERQAVIGPDGIGLDQFPGPRMTFVVTREGSYHRSGSGPWRRDLPDPKPERFGDGPGDPWGFLDVLRFAAEHGEPGEAPPLSAGDDGALSLDRRLAAREIPRGPFLTANGPFTLTWRLSDGYVSSVTSHSSVEFPKAKGMLPYVSRLELWDHGTAPRFRLGTPPKLTLGQRVWTTLWWPLFH